MGLKDRQLAIELPRQREVAEPDLRHGEPIKERGSVGGRELVPRLRQLCHRGLGRIAALQAPEVQASQLNLQVRTQVLLGLVEDLQRVGTLALPPGQPGEGEPILEDSRIVGLCRAQE